MVSRCHLSAWTRVSTLLGSLRFLMAWDRATASVWAKSAGLVLGSFCQDHGAGASARQYICCMSKGESVLCQGLSPGLTGNCWWCQPFAVAASHPKAGLGAV